MSDRDLSWELIPLEEISKEELSDFLPEDEYTTNQGDGSSGQNALFDVPITFYYASGSGAWGSEITISPDWSFRGSFHDTDGDMRSQCEYTGQIIDARKTGEFTWSFRIESITPDRPYGENWSENGLKCISASPYGITENTTYTIYLPGADDDILPPVYLSVLLRGAGPLERYSLFNPEGQAVFWGFEKDAHAAESGNN